MRLVAICAIIAASCSLAKAGESNFRASSDLIAEGFVPVSVSSTAKATYGLFKMPDLYLCFLADNENSQKQRVAVISANLAGDSTSATVPNIPVVCVLTE